MQAQQLAGERALQQIEAERDAYQAQAAATAADLFRAQKRGATLNLQLAGARHRLRAALEPEAVPGAGDVAAADEAQQDGSLEMPTAGPDTHSREDDDETAALRAAVRAEQVQQPLGSRLCRLHEKCRLLLCMTGGEKEAPHTLLPAENKA